MRFLHSRTGFTLLELILVLALIVIFALALIPNLFGSRGRTEFDAAGKQMVVLLREAQNRSIAQASSSAWGVHFENATTTTPFYALFAYPYSSSSVLTYYRLSSRVQYASTTIALGASKEIVFQQISGFASASTTVGILFSGDSQVSSTLRVSSSGAVTY